MADHPRRPFRLLPDPPPDHPTQRLITSDTDTAQIQALRERVAACEDAINLLWEAANTPTRGKLWRAFWRWVGWYP